MADFLVHQAVVYFGGAKDERTSGPATATFSNAVAGDVLTPGDAMVILRDGEDQTFGDFYGTVTVGGNTFIVVYLGQEVGNDIYFVAGPAEPAYASFPDSFEDLAIDQVAFTVCFLAGTRIATPAGETPVESLAIGDVVLTADGRSVPVRWVGVQTVATLFADPLRSFPIRVTAGALGPDMPVRDLLVSPDHALFLDGVLVQAGALVNGTTIVRETAMPERFTYFHVELDDHSLILAEGVPAETFLDTVTRRRFDNWADYEARYGDTGPVLTELATPRIKSARQLPQALRERLAERATTLHVASAAVRAA